MERLDVFLVEKYGFSSRNKAQEEIKNGYIKVDGKVIKKPSFVVDDKNQIEILDHERFVSRGGYKLLGAIEHFKIDLSDKVVLDIGASTGGFTDVALQHGAKKVYSLDVGTSELCDTIKKNKKVVNMEKTDFRDAKKEDIADVDIVTGDLSFISLKLIMPKIKELYSKDVDIVMLFKPQFECGIKTAAKFKGVIKNQNIHKKLLKEFKIFLSSLGYSLDGLMFSPIQGKGGNIEYLFYISNKTHNYQSVDIDKTVDFAFQSFQE